MLKTGQAAISAFTLTLMLLIKDKNKPPEDNMKKVAELDFGSIDAVNYKSRDEKQFLSRIMYKEDYLEKILEKKRYFLIGEKGTGKTSYAVYLNNTDENNTLSQIISLSQTDYSRFINLNTLGKFPVSSYPEIWRVILLLLVSDSIAKKFPKTLFNFPKFKAIHDAIDDYYETAFRPEVEQTLEIIENAEVAGKILSKYAGIEVKDKRSSRENIHSYQVNLSILEKRFTEALESLKLEKDFILFIDGIDIRPNEIPFDSYISCIRGLAQATWQLNTEFFNGIRDLKSKIKIMILMRPDILDSMDFQNLNAKVRDNGVVLNWITPYDNFQNSSLFKLISKIFKSQQSNLEDKTIEDFKIWKHYFHYQFENLKVSEKFDDPFVGLLRYSFYRPRDIVQYLKLMQEYVKNYESDTSRFSRESFFKCQQEFSDYLLGEVKDYLRFYYSSIDFDEVIGFFSEFEGQSQFTWTTFKIAFERLKIKNVGKNMTIAELNSSPEELLQFLYSLNIIAFVEVTGDGERFIHYCFRDRTPVKLRPRVKLNLEYTVHPGLQRALLVGGGARPQKISRNRRKFENS
jgi:hypothetical protein